MFGVRVKTKGVFTLTPNMHDYGSGTPGSAAIDAW